MEGGVFVGAALAALEVEPGEVVEVCCVGVVGVCNETLAFGGERGGEVRGEV